MRIFNSVKYLSAAIIDLAREYIVEKKDHGEHDIRGDTEGSGGR